MSTLSLLVLLQAFILNIAAPAGYKRIPDKDFGDYLRHIRLKSDRTVYLYNGQKKQNQDAQYAVLDVSVGTKDLQQCADAVMRLRGEFLFSKGQTPSFRAVSGKEIRYSTGLTRTQYFERVFSLCNSYSLEQQMHSIPIRTIQIGDVLIRGGFPGHVVMVVDMAVNRSGEKVMMLAQSYMPAQNIHVLKGPVDGVWYPVKDGQINTPEYRFTSDQVRTW